MGERDQRPGVLERAASYARALALTPAMAGATLMTAAAIVATRRSRGGVDALMRGYSQGVLRAFGVTLEVRGLEHLPDGPALYLFNHQSNADPPIVQAALPRSARFGAKIELFSIPVFGAGLRAAGILPIARDNLREVLGVYEQAARRFADGESFILAPEGTRQDDDRIGPFKKGPFRLAIDAQVPLCPLVLKGTHEVLPKHGLLVNADRWRRTVTVQILPPVPTRGLGKDDVERLRDEVREQMVRAFEAL